MNLDLLPLSAFALESSRGADRVLAEPYTLTLRLTRARLDCASQTAMGGTAAADTCTLKARGVLRAAVLPASGPGLTLTFQDARPTQ